MQIFLCFFSNYAFTVMGQVLANGLDIMGTGRSPILDPSFKQSIDDMCSLASGQSGLTDREKKHVHAIELCGQG